MIAMNASLHIHSPLLDVLGGLAMIVAGVLLLIYRNDIGAFTGYYASRGAYVDKPTPGWMLIPFALILIVGGLIVFIQSFNPGE